MSEHDETEIQRLREERNQYKTRSEQTERELANARALIQHDATGLAAGLDRVRQLATSYGWLGAEWGSYEETEQTEETLRREIDDALTTILEVVSDTLRASGARADKAFHGPFDAVVEEKLETRLVAAERDRDEAQRMLIDWEWERCGLGHEAAGTTKRMMADNQFGDGAGARLFPEEKK